MNKKIILIILLLISICLSGCTDKPEPIEYEILKVDIVKVIDENSIQKYDFDIVYVDEKGYIKHASTSKKDIYNRIELRQSYDDKYRLLYIDRQISYHLLELHIPKDMIEML